MTSSKWPSPAEDYIESTLDLNTRYITNRPATFLFRSVGDDMLGAGIRNNDILIVDRSLAPGPGKIVVANIEGRRVIRRIKKSGDRLYLKSERPGEKEVAITESADVAIFGVVKHVIHTFAY